MSPSYRRLSINLEVLREARESCAGDDCERFVHLALLKCAGLLSPALFKRAIEAALEAFTVGDR